VPQHHLRNWLQVALCDDSSIYEVGEQRQQLIAFHDELQLLVESLFMMCSRNTDDDTIKQKIAVTKLRLLTRIKFQVVTAFFDKFPMAYILRELNDWVEAGVSYPGTYPGTYRDTMSELQALHTFRTVVCLVKSVKRLRQRRSSG